ncbi:MAG: phytoene/squalene synthase family protein [Deltaproteobacteria bacterium]|nr:phytoene/squalene synthase family protein [Deltaproteobacteria bacterium]
MAAGGPTVEVRPGETDTEALLRVLSAGSKSFSLAGKLMRPSRRAAAAAVYAWCRRADDLIDDAPEGLAEERATQLRRELDALYGPGGPVDGGSWEGVEGRDELALRAFAQIARERGIPRQYPDELVNGMEMDVRCHRYESAAELKLYCYRVASTVGLMMCHVMGVKDDRALEPAVHLGVALQLTNISRDVLEDWHMGRLYLPQEWLGDAGPDLLRRLEAAGPHGDPGELPRRWESEIRAATRRLLTTAERYYNSADRGLQDLPLTSASAIRAARWIYREIGAEVWRRDFDVWQGRAVVRTRRKAFLLGRSALLELAWAPLRLRRERGGRVPGRVIEDPAEALGTY